MLLRNLAKITSVVLFIAVIGLTQIIAQDAKKPFVVNGVFWFDKDSATEVYLLPYQNLNYRLTVISPKEVKVSYHTAINSFEPVDRELAAKETAGAVRYYEFEHYFSKMTIWMSLEFTVDGKKVPVLTRTFYNSIFEVAENDYFVKPKPKN
jgi:hypothetical protein